MSAETVKVPLTMDDIDLAARNAMLEIIHDTSFFLLLRIIASVRWGSIGRNLTARRKREAAKL